MVRFKETFIMAMGDFLHRLRLKHFVLLTVAALTLGVFFAWPTQAAPGDAKWINRATIEYNGVYYKDSNPSDNSFQFSANLPEHGACPSTISFAGPNANEMVRNDLFYYKDSEIASAQRATFVTPAGQKDAANNVVCDVKVQPSATINVIEPMNRRVTFIAISEDTIMSYKGAIFKRTPNRSHVWQREDGDPAPCKDVIYHAGNPFTDPRGSNAAFSDDHNRDSGDIWQSPQQIGQSAVLYAVRDKNSPGDRKAESYADVMGGTDVCPIHNADLYETFGAVGNTGGGDHAKVQSFIANGVNGVTGEHLTTQGCPGNNPCKNDDTFAIFVGNLDNLEKNADNTPKLPTAPGSVINTATCKGGGLGWIVCPLVSMIEGAAKLLEGLIVGLLKVPPLPVDVNSDLYKVWDGFRNFSNIIFVLGFMSIVVATALGINNYGVKTMLPVLIAAAILSNLSYFICSFLVDFFNILGVGVGNLVALAYGGQGGTVNVGNLEGGIAIGALGAAITYGIVSGAIVNILPMIAAAAIALVIMTIALVIRQDIILAVEAASALIISLAVLPGMRPLVTNIFSTYITLLAMQPLVVLMFALGRVVTDLLTSVA